MLFFGPSGSGKTFAMQGKTGNLRGIVPRAVEEVLSLTTGATSSLTRDEDTL